VWGRVSGVAGAAGVGEVRMVQLAEAVGHLDPPFAVVDLDAFDVNAAELARRTGGAAADRVHDPVLVGLPRYRSSPTLAPLLASVLITSGPGYPGLFAVVGVASAIGAVLVYRIRSVR
jgi:hypothetical protein